MLTTPVVQTAEPRAHRPLRFHPSLDEARALAPQGNVLPVYCELPADLETPVSVYLKLRGDGASFLLESVEGGEQIARYSFLGVHPAARLVADSHGVRLTNGHDEAIATAGDPLAAVKQVMRRTRMIQLPGLPPFVGGAVGYMSYDLVRHFERVPNTAIDDRDLPLCDFLFTDSLVIFDHVKHRLLVVANAYLDRPGADGDPVGAAYADAVQRIEAIVERLRRPMPEAIVDPTGTTYPLTSNTTRARYESMVEAAKEYIAAGDIFQVVLSQRIERETDAEPFAIYRALRMLNPSPYMVFLDLGETKVIASSPEMMTRLEDDVAEVRPIAGTRRRGATEAEDAALAEELMADPKERAEHVMLVDLGRNDLGRVCQYGTVRVPDLMVIERYSHVMHIVSRVRGQMVGGKDAFDLVRATFPAGTLSGAPKVRAMEIIEELEGVRRGPYGGAIGYFGYTGSLDSCITIRTIIMRGRHAYIQAGAGIVADSVPSHEYEESVNKARALAVAISTAEEGF